MKPKKREKIVQEETKAPFEQIQADHELFLQAFEKPTQIYRYLRTRNLVSPIFLHRNLSYMPGRMSRKHNSRNDFQADSLLDKVVSKHNDQSTTNYKSEYMNLTFTGFFDKGNHSTESVEVEAYLMKICHKKRKEVSSPVLRISIGKVHIPCNPDRSSPTKAQAVAVGSSNFSHNNGHTPMRSYMLHLQVNCTRRLRLDPQDHGICNGDISEIEDPPSKKRRTRSCSEEPVEYYDEKVSYGAELMVYDKHQRCQLTEGDYELALQEVGTRLPLRGTPTWETVVEGKAVGPFEAFHTCPTLKFKLSWGQHPLNGTVDPPLPIPSADEFMANNHFSNHSNNHIVDKDIVGKNNLLVEKRSRENRKRVFYHFRYNNNTGQQTEPRDDLHCPWCSLNCMQLYSLLKHLRLCHARFTFTYQEHPKGALIEVSINECYDGSYAGNPQDLHSHIGFAFSRTGPVRRTPVHHLIVYRPKKPSFDLGEFLEAESEAHTSRQLVQGHNRLYYNSITIQPVRPHEIDIDCEAYNDPEWLRQKTINLIDEFTDVNEGEKEVMKMWNLHVMHHNYIADCQLPTACKTFVEEYGPRAVRENLCRNFVLHLVNLFDFGLLKPEIVYRSTMYLYRLQEQLEDSTSHKAASSTSRLTSTSLTSKFMSTSSVSLASYNRTGESSSSHSQAGSSSTS